MFNPGFYPTPDHVARKMLSRFSAGGLLKSTILEPSAGKGDLCDAIRKKVEDRYPARYGDRESPRPRIHCCETEPELQATLQGKGYPLTGTDFLSFSPDEAYDLIIMNPPFANGEKHLLHAWDILPHGAVVCLLNAATLDNPHTSGRQLLCRIIEQHGEVERLGSCFADDAFRKTDVEVVLVRLYKKAEPIAFELFGDCRAEADAAGFDADGLGEQVATRNTIGNLVITYERARECFRRLLPLAAEMAFYAKQLKPSSCGKSAQEGFIESMNGIFTADGPEDQARLYNLFLRGLKRDGWLKVFNMTKARNFMSQRVAEDFDKQREQMAQTAFSEENIVTFLHSLRMNSGEIMRRCVLEAFDLFTRFDKKNTSHFEGWKTNDAWRVNRKVIIPVVWRLEAWEDLAGVLYRVERKLDDIDRALAYLEGRTLEDVRCIAAAVVDHINPIVPGTEPNYRGERPREKNPDWPGTQFESEFFHIRAFKKGTLHLEFKDKGLWERFNLEAARGKNWLPDDYKARERAAEKSAVVPMRSFA